MSEPAGNRPVDLSIVVCTRDRAELLGGVIESLLSQSAETIRGRHDLWIVDNGSRDATPERARALAAAHAHVHAVREERTGLAHARNRGWRACGGRFVAFVDDDARVPDGWIARALAILEASAPDLLGGPYRPFYLAPKPDWFRDDYLAMSCGPAARALGPGEFLSGTNLVIRRELLERLGGFDVTLGMRGAHTAYGEETELQERARRELSPPPLVWYDPGLEMLHLVRPEKLTLAWMVRDRWARGRDGWRLRREREGRARAPALRALRIGALAPLHAASLAARLLFAAAFRDRRRFPSLRNAFWERSGRHVQALGALGAEARDLMGRGPAPP